MDAFGEYCHWDGGVVEGFEGVVDFMRDVEEWGEGKGFKLMRGEFASPRVKDLEHLLCQLDFPIRTILRVRLTWAPARTCPTSISAQTSAILCNNSLLSLGYLYNHPFAFS